MKAWSHFLTVTRHRRLVRRYCFRLGLYWQGLTHDLSKYSPAEFLVGAKYYQGTRSPNNAEREDIGYSSSWLHHKGRNKHHFEYWIDYTLDKSTCSRDGRPRVKLVGMKMPRRYVAEMVIDRMSASKNYQKENYVEYLSRGMKQKLCMARCLLNEPKLLIMDEPASGLDPRSRYEFRQIMKKLHENGNTILISSHILSDLAEICTDICIIDKGRIMLSGSIEEIEDSMSMAGSISIRSGGGQQELIDILRQDKLVESISYNEGTVRIHYRGCRDDAALLLKKIVDQGIQVYSFNIDSDNLESLFMKITS